MRYKHYERLICLKHRVKLRGWPEDIKFDSPYQLGKIDDLEKLRDALRSGECKWVKIKPDEYKELQKKLDAEEPPTRETRSDKGQKRKRDGKENEVAQKRTKRKAGGEKSAAALKKKVEKRLPATLKSLKNIKSPEFVNSDDDESAGKSDESDEEGGDGGDSESDD